MRDRRPPSNPWDCGTRAANFRRQRAILMAFNTPFTLRWRYFLYFVHHVRTAAARPRPEPFTFYLRWSWHVRRWYSLLVHCLTAVAARPRPGPFNRSVLARPTFCPFTCCRSCFVHGRDPSVTAGPGASDVVSCSLLVLWQRVHG
jgi:hypothetical protein